LRSDGFSQSTQGAQSINGKLAPPFSSNFFHEKNSCYFSPVKRTLILVLLFLFAADLLLSQPVNKSISRITSSDEADTVKIKKLLLLFNEFKSREPEQALAAAENAYKLANEKNLEFYKGRALGFMGTANYSLDRYTEALEHYLGALQIYEALGRQRDQGVILNNIGNIFLDQELPDQALPYYQRALAIDEALKSDKDIAMDLMNLSSAYSVTPKLDSAYLLCTHAMEKAEALKDTFIYSQCLGNIGIIEFQQKKYDAALLHINAAEKLFREHNIEANLCVLFLSLGDIYLEKKDIAKARMNYTKALENSIPLESVDDERLAYLGLSKCAEQSGNIPAAFSYFKKYSVLNDSLFNFKSSRKQTQLLLNYELEKKEVLVKAGQEKKEAIHASELHRQRAQKNIFIAGFIIVFILSFIMMRLYRQKNKSNKQLSEALENLEQSHSQLIHQEKMASLGMLSAGIAHEIQNPLNFVTNFSDSSLEILKELKETSDEAEKQQLMQELSMNIEKISGHGKRADSIIKSMLRHSHGNPEDMRPTNVNKLCDEFLMLAFQSIRASNPEFNSRIEKNYQPDMPKVNLMTQEMTRVMLNLFTNAFHALKERQQQESNFSPVITITTKVENSQAKIQVRDNGTGIPQKIRDKIFQPFFTTKKSGEGTGLGLSISYDIVKAQGGELKVDSREGEFTEFTMILPI